MPRSCAGPAKVKWIWKYASCRDHDLLKNQMLLYFTVLIQLKPQRLLTHPGGAHKDDFLACCLFMALYRLPVVRREPGEDDLEDPQTIVIDVGGLHDPERSNFDHHQFPRDYPPTCALTLVLQHLGLYEDAQLFCEWLETTERFDARGPHETARWLGVDRETLARLNSPIDLALLKRFSQCLQLLPGEPLWEVMAMIGEDTISYLRVLRERLQHMEENVEFWEIEVGGDTLHALFLPRSPEMPDNPAMGIGRFLKRKPMELRVAALVYPDRRGNGYGLSRHNDCLRLDFTRLKHFDDVHFAHERGFIAKTSAVDAGRLKELLGLAWS